MADATTESQKEVRRVDWAGEGWVSGQTFWKNRFMLFTHI